MFDGKSVLITGGTGTLGTALVQKILTYDVQKIRIFSRDENKQVLMREKFQDTRLRFLIGDIRDKERLKRAVEDIDIIIHTAALKHVPVAEYNPFEFIKTNIAGSQNVIDVAIDEEVDTCLAISTDKAVSPLNLYGATKLAMEKLFISANQYKGKRKTKFSCVRYGNVLGSRGSVVPKFIEQIRSGKEITVTDPSMTRFTIQLGEALDFIIKSLGLAKGSEVFIPKLRAYSLADLIESLKELSKTPFKIKNIPIRMGEKTHEVLLNEYEMKFAFESDDLYVLLPPDISEMESLQKLYPSSKPIGMKEYSSDLVPKMTLDEIKKILIANNLVP